MFYRLNAEGYAIWYYYMLSMRFFSMVLMHFQTFFYVGGTRDGKTKRRIDEYDPSTGQWRHRDDMHFPTWTFSPHSVTIGKTVYFAKNKSVQFWNGTSDQFGTLPTVLKQLSYYHVNGAFVINAD